MTLAELAGKIGIQPGPLGNIERGKSGPSARVILALCEALEVHADAIFQGETSAIGTYRPYELQLPSDRDCEIPAKLLGVLRQEMDDFLTLEDLCSAQKTVRLPLRIPVDFSEAGMERLAGEIRQLMRIEYGVVFDYFEIFETLGFRIKVIPLDNFHSISFADRLNHNAFFFLDERVNAERQIFRLAYELGLLLLQQSPNRNEPKDGAANLRTLAKRFAAVFLMPTPAILATTNQLGITQKSWSFQLLLRIKHRFGVSAESFLIRLQELELIDKKDAKAHAKTICTHYQNTDFGEPDSTRRILSPNGRFGDLLHQAVRLHPKDPELLDLLTRHTL